MESSTLLILTTVVLGLIGVAYMVAAAPGPTKTRKGKDGLKPRGALARHPATILSLLTPCHLHLLAAWFAEDLYAQ